MSPPSRTNSEAAHAFDEQRTAAETTHSGRTGTKIAIGGPK